MTRSVILRSGATKDLDMRMRFVSPFASLRVTVILFLIGCASATPDSRKAPLDEPEIVISQISNIAEAARHISGPISVQYQVEVANHSKNPMAVKRIDVVSLGAGA